MGWTTLHRAKGQSNDDFFTAELLNEHRHVVASSTIAGIYYAAVQDTKTDETFGLVVLTHRAPRSHHNFGYKPVTEDMGPNATDAPAKVLDALTETSSEYALEWRAACRLKLARPKVTKGSVVRFAQPLEFSDGTKAAEFVYGGRGNLFTLPGRSVRFSIPRWRNATYELIGA